MIYRGIIKYQRKYFSKGENREITYTYWKIMVWTKDGQQIYGGSEHTLRDALKAKNALLRRHPDLKEIKVKQIRKGRFHAILHPNKRYL